MTIPEWIQVIRIVDKYHPGEGLYTGAEHDIIYLNLFPRDVAEDSEDGKKLLAFGFHVDSDSWAKYV